MRQGSYGLKFSLLGAFALLIILPAVFAQSIPPPPISVEYDRKAWDELLQTSLGRTVYFEVRTQVAATISEQIRKAELDESGMPREIKDFAKIRALEKFFDQMVNPMNGHPILNPNEVLPNGLKTVPRQEYYLQQIERSLLETSGANRGRPKWLDESMNNWRQIFSDLRAVSVSVAYDLEVYPNFKSVDVFLSDPKLLKTAVGGDQDIVRAKVLARLAPNVKVNSIGGYVEMPGFTYQLPLFPEYGQTWSFPDVTGAVDLATSLDISAPNPFSANFGPLVTNLGEIKNSEGDVVWGGVRVAKSDVDYFMDQLLKVERYEKILETFYSPDEWEEKEGLAGPFKELPISRKILVQSVRDAENILSERKLPLILYLYRVGENEIDVGYSLKADDAFEKTLADLRAQGRLIALFDGDIPLTARPSVDVDLKKREMYLGLDLPAETEVTFQVRELNVPHFLLKDLKNPMVRKIIDSLPKGNLLGPDAKVTLRLSNAGTPPDFVGPPFKSIPTDIRMTIPYTYMTPSEWRLKRLDQMALIEDETKKEFPTFVVDDTKISADFSGLKTAYISKLEAHLNPGIPPLVLFPRSDRSLSRQAYDQVPVLLQNVRAMVPKKTMKTIEDSIQDRLQELVSGINKKVVQPDMSFNVEIYDFQLPEDAVQIKWDGVRDPAKNLVAVDPLMLSTAYPYLFNLAAKHELTTVLKLPKKLGVKLRNLDNPEAKISMIDIQATSTEEQEVTIQWKIVEDAAGDLHTLPYVWNLPEVLKNFDLSKVDYDGLQPKGIIEGAASSAAIASGGVGFLGGLVKQNGVELIEGGLSGFWLGRRLNNVGIGWLGGQAAGAFGWGYEKVGGGIQSLYNSLATTEIESKVKEAFYKAKPDLIDTILEQAVKGVNGELKPDYPLDAAEKQNLIWMKNFYTPNSTPSNSNVEAENKKEEETSRKRNIDLRRYQLEQEWLLRFSKPEPPPRDKEAPMPVLQKTFEGAFGNLEEFAPVRNPLGDWKNKGEPLLGAIENRIEGVLQEAVNGERSDFWPEELTNRRMIRASENDLIPAIRRQVENLPKDNQPVVEGVIQPDKILGAKTNEAVNALIEKALRGEMTGTNSDQKSPPIAEPGPKFKLDLPTVVCRGLPLDPDGNTNDSLVLLNLYRGADRGSLPAGLMTVNPQAEIQKRIEAILYWDSALWDPNVKADKDLSEAGQVLRNQIFGNEPSHRTPRGAAIFELNSLLETVVKPNMDGILRDLEAKIVKDQGLANDSLHIRVSNLNIKVGPKPETGEQGFVVDFDLEVKQKGIGKDGVLKILSGLGLFEINTTGSKPWFSGEGDPKPLHITWPLQLSLSNRANERPETDGQIIKPGYDLHLASDFPIKVDGPRASRSLESWILLKGPLADALRDFKISLPIDRSIGIPTLEKYTQVELRPPVMLPSENGRGFAVIPFSIIITEEGQQLPKQLDQEIIVRPMEKLVPYLLAQPETTLFDRSARAVLSRLPEKYRSQNLQFQDPEDGRPALRESANGELEYHVNVSVAESSSVSLPKKNYQLVYKVSTLLEHDDKGADLVARLSAPKLIKISDGGTEVDFNRLNREDFLHYLERTDSPNFVWDRVPIERLSEISYR